MSPVLSLFAKSPALLLVGLGNPGREYEATRHNIGMMWLDDLHTRHGATPWQKKFDGLFSSFSFAGTKVYLLKPQTYMNLSGKSVLPALTFFKLKPAQVMVVHDELDLPFGEMRQKTGGGDAGHNGLKSITQAIGPAYHRLRLGIGRPELKDQVSSYVLHPFSPAEQPQLAGWLGHLTDDLSGILANTGQIKA